MLSNKVRGWGGGLSKHAESNKLDFVCIVGIFPSLLKVLPAIAKNKHKTKCEGCCQRQQHIHLTICNILYNSSHTPDAASVDLDLNIVCIDSYRIWHEGPPDFSPGESQNISNLACWKAYVEALLPIISKVCVKFTMSENILFCLQAVKLLDEKLGHFLGKQWTDNSFQPKD